MAFGNFLRGLAAQVNPFDKGKTYGSYNPPQKRKRPEEEVSNAPRLSVGNATPTQRITVEDQMPQPKQPTNIFETLNKNLVFNKPQNTVPILNNPNTQLAPMPQPGTIVKPTILPKPSIPLWKRALNDVGNVGSAAVGTSLGVLRAGEGLVQGAADVPNLAAHALTYAPRKLAGDDSKINRGLSTVNRAGATITKKVTTPVNWLAKKTDEAALGYGPGSRTVYKPAQIGTNIVTLIPGATEGAAALASRLSKTEDLSKSGGALGALGRAKNLIEKQRVSPILTKLDEMLGGNLSRSRFLRNLMTKTEDVAPEVALGSEEIANQATQVPVSTGISVNQPVSEPINIPVRNVNQPGRLIQEVGGDARLPTSNTEAAENALNVRRVEAARKADVGLPDRTIEGVTPRPNDRPFTLNPETSANAQDKIVDDYADMLRNMGEGNGVNIVPDGEGGYKRVSDNFRPGDTGGKRMTKGAWRDEAQRQLESGQAEPSVQGAFNDATNPEVQALLSKGEQTLVPEGRPITVKQATGIPVRDETVVPQDLPEKPGTVRVTQSTAPSNAKSEAVAAEQLPIVSNTKAAVADTNIPLATPATPKEADVAIDSAYERLVKSLKENQKAQRVEKKINSAEKSRRFAEKQRIYNDLVESGMSRKEAEQQAMAALKGKYADNTVANFDVDSKQAEAFRKAIDSNSDDPMNTKRAFEHLIDPAKTDPLQPWERTRIRRFVQNTLGDDAAQALEEAIVMAEKTDDPSVMGRISSEVTSAIASGDISATGRQGLFGLVNHPVMSKNAFVDSMKALANPEEYKNFASKLTNDPNTAFIQEQMGGKYQTLSDIADEARGGDTSNKLTSWYVNPSNRQYNVYLDSLRHQQKSAIIERYGGQDGFLKAAQSANPENPEKWMKAWNRVVDTMSGRGTLTKNTGSPAIGDVQVLFSWRNLVSKFQKVTAPAHLGLLKTNKDAYLYQLREVAQPTAVLGTTLALVGASGLAEIENGKIKIGNTRIDITGGIATILTAANKMRQAFTDESKSGYGDRTAGDIATDFFKNQLSPMLGTLARLADARPATGKDKYGNELDAGWWLSKAPLPGVVQTAIQSKQGDESWFKTAANVFSEGLGFGSTTYQSAADKKAAKVVKSGIKPADYPTTKEDVIAGEGYSLQQLDNGRYAYNLDGEVKTTSNLKEAQQAIAKDSFTKSGENSKIIKDKYYYKDENGDTKVMPKYKHEFDVADSQNQLDMYIAKDDEDYGAWAEAADKQLDALTTLRDKYNKDSQEDKVDDVQKKIETLKHDMRKYKGYGGFTKGKAPKALDTSFGTLKASAFAPQLKQYDTIDTKSGSVPHISVVRPNIVHKITSG